MSDLSTSTASTLSAVDLSKLAFPSELIARDYESVLAEMMADANAYYQAKTGQKLIVHEADPAYVVMEACAYRRHKDLLDYQSQIKNMLVAYASGVWLDHLGANPDYKCARLVIVPADPVNNIEAVMESDDDYRARLVLTNEGYTTAGSSGAYLFHALSASGDVRDASVQSPTPGQVLVTVLSNSNNGAAATTLINTVNAALNAETVRPLCDQVSVQAATINTYSVNAQLTTYPTADIPGVLTRAKASIEAYTAAHFRLGHDITRAGLIAAATVSGVQNVNLVMPSTDLVTDLSTARRCTAVTVAQIGAQL